MNIIAAAILGLVQAVTEFLPVSSSGHLALTQGLFQKYFDLKSVPISFDVFLHFATLLATAVFVRKDILRICKGLLSGDPWSQRVSISVILASIPAGIIGITFKDFVEESFAAIGMVGLGFLLTSIFLETVQRKQNLIAKNQGKDSSGLSLGGEWEVPSPLQALLIGVSQAISIFPGVSRSGSTICSALLLGLSKETAIHFSFLMSLPVIAGATLLESKALLELPASEMPAYLVGFLVAFLAALVAIRFLVVAVRKLNLRPFSIYTFLLGVICASIHFSS